ncbi:hypothetical protein ABW20_dc0108206 [Dactylellina cionopaga]|nr:hypothetical protein ABW20_dc0108206 [Dactylellina cionopaga]
MAARAAFAGRMKLTLPRNFFTSSPRPRRSPLFPFRFFNSLAPGRTNLLNSLFFTPTNLQSKAVAAPLNYSFTPLGSISTAVRNANKVIRLPPSSRRAFSTSTTPVNANGNGHLTLGQRMRQLSKEYGMSAVGVYFLLSVLDFPFCFLFVQMVGTEKIARYEHIIVDGFWKIMPEAIAQFRPKAIKEAKAEAQGIGGELDSLAHGEGTKDGSKTGEASLWTVLILAYAVHKSLIFFRVPLTAAVTPKIVQKLRSWGFNIGKKGGVRKGVMDARANLKERRAKKGKKDLDDD